jgi:hypothetical protein
MIPQGGIDRNIQAAKLRAGSNPNVLAQEYKKTQSIETLLAMQSLKEELGKREQEIAAQMQGPEGSIMEQTEAQLMALVNPQSDSTNDVLGQMAPVMDRRGKEEAKAQMMPSGPKPPPPIQGKAPAPPNGAPQGIAGLNPRMGMAEGGIVPPADRYAEGGFTKLPPQDPTPDSLKWLMTEAPETTGYTAEQLTNANNVFRDSNGRMQMGRPQGILKNHIEGLDGPDTTDYSALIPSQEEQDARATDFWGSSPSLMSINALYRGVAPEGHYTRYLNDIEQNTARGILNGTVEYTPDTRLDNPLYDPYTGLYRNAPEPYVPGTPTFGPQPVPVDQGNNQVDGFTAPIDSNNQNNNQAPVVELASSNNQNNNQAPVVETPSSNNQNNNQAPVVELPSSNNQALPYGADFSNKSEIEMIDEALEAGVTPEQIITHAPMLLEGGLTPEGLSYLEDTTGYSPDGMAEGGMVGYADGGEVAGEGEGEGASTLEGVNRIMAKLREGGMSTKDLLPIRKKLLQDLAAKMGANTEAINVASNPRGGSLNTAFAAANAPEREETPSKKAASSARVYDDPTQQLITDLGNGRSGVLGPDGLTSDQATDPTLELLDVFSPYTDTINRENAVGQKIKDNVDNYMTPPDAKVAPPLQLGQRPAPRSGIASALAAPNPSSMPRSEMSLQQRMDDSVAKRMQAAGLPAPAPRQPSAMTAARKGLQIGRPAMAAANAQRMAPATAPPAGIPAAIPQQGATISSQRPPLMGAANNPATTSITAPTSAMGATDTTDTTDTTSTTAATQPAETGLAALAKELKANRNAATAYNAKLNDPKKSAWERFSAGARNASDAGGGTALGNYSKGSASEQARQERQQQMFLNENASMIGQEMEYGLTSAKNKALADLAVLESQQTALASNAQYFAQVNATLEDFLAARQEAIQNNVRSSADPSEDPEQYNLLMAKFNESADGKYYANAIARTNAILNNIQNQMGANPTTPKAPAGGVSQNLQNLIAQRT